MNNFIAYIMLFLYGLIANRVAAGNGIVGKNGIIGFGLSYYQDLCYQACYDSLSTLYLSCTTFMDMGGDGVPMSDMDMDISMMGMTSDECYTSNIPWLQTMACCIRQKCDLAGYPADKQAMCFSNQAIAGASTPTFHNSLPAIPPTVELDADAIWLNVTSLVNSDVYHATYGTEGEFARTEYIHTRYA
ncbi:hypothetical protein MMC25_000612 [Agyrium rufum]|nr:hypothetical protein [Agyrium rufum]